MPLLWLLIVSLPRPRYVSEHSRTEPVGMLTGNSSIGFWGSDGTVVGGSVWDSVIPPARCLLWLYFHSFLHPHLPPPWTLAKEVPRGPAVRIYGGSGSVSSEASTRLGALMSVCFGRGWGVAGRSATLTSLAHYFCPADPRSSEENSSFEDGPWSVMNPANRCFWPSKSWSS